MGLDQSRLLSDMEQVNPNRTGLGASSDDRHGYSHIGQRTMAGGRAALEGDAEIVRCAAQ